MIRFGLDSQPVDLTAKEIAALQAEAASAAPLPKYFISKVEMWKRCSDGEVEGFFADLRQAPARYQALFDGAAVIDTRDDFFPVLQAIVQARVGPERAVVILEPTS